MSAYGWLWRCATCQGAVVLVADTWEGRGRLEVLLEAARLGTADLMLRSQLLAIDRWQVLVQVPPCGCDAAREEGEEEETHG